MNPLRTRKAAQERCKVGHDFLGLTAAVFPAQAQRGQQGAQVRLVKAAAFQHGGDQRAEAFGDEPVLRGGLVHPTLSRGAAEGLIALPDGLLVQRLAHGEGVDIGGDGVALVHELGIGGDEAHKLIAGELHALRGLASIFREQGHDIIVIDTGRGKEHQLEIQLAHLGGGVPLPLVLPAAHGLRRFQIDALEGLHIVGGQNGLDLGVLLLRAVGVLVEPGLEALHLPEQPHEARAGLVALERGHGLRREGHSLRFHEAAQVFHGLAIVGNDLGRGLHQPDLAGALGVPLAGKEPHGLVHGVPLLAEVEDVAEGLGIVEDAVGARKCLDETVIAQVFVHIEGVEILGVKAGEEHVHHDGDVHPLRVRHIGERMLLRLDAPLHVLIIAVELDYRVIRAVAGVVVVNDGGERGLFALRVHGVVGALLRQILLKLLDVPVALGGRGKDAGDVQRPEGRVRGLALGLPLLKQLVVGYGLGDGAGGEQGAEPAVRRGAVMPVEDGVHDGAAALVRAGARAMLALRAEIIHMEAEDVAVFDGVGDGVGMELAVENVFRGSETALLALGLPVLGVFLINGRAGEAEKLRVGEELADGAVVFAKLGAVALVKNKDHALVAQGRELFAPSGATARVQRQRQLLDGGDDDLVFVLGGEQPLHQRGGVGVLLHAVFLKLVELLPGLAVEVLAVHHKEALGDVRVALEQGGGLEGGQRLAAARGVPDVAVAVVAVDAVHDGLDRIDLVGAHHDELPLGGHEDDITADHGREGALGEKGVGKGVQAGDLFVVPVGEAVEGQEVFRGVKGEVALVVIGKIPGVTAVADDEYLDEAEDGAGVAVAGVALVVDDLLHGPARADGEVFQLYLHHRDAVEQQDDVIAVVAARRVDAQLAHHLKAVLAPLAGVHQGEGKLCAVVALQRVAVAQGAGGLIDVT